MEKTANEKIHNLFSSPNIIRMTKSRKMRCAGHVVRGGKMRNAFKILVGKSEENRPIKRPKRRWEDNIKMNLRKKYWATWIGFMRRQGPVAGFCEHGNEHSRSIKTENFLAS
jgi:hypothetical protein